MEPWDLVEIHGLVTATQLNGKFAFIRSYEKEEKRYQVEIKPDQPPVLIKRRNAKLVRQITRQVVRMNVDQGGTLKGGEDDWDTLLSFEWIDASEPSIDVDLDHTMEDFAWKPSSNCKEVSRKDLEQSRDKNLKKFVEQVSNWDFYGKNQSIDTQKGCQSLDTIHKGMEEAEGDADLYYSILMEQKLLVCNPWFLHPEEASKEQEPKFSKQAMKVIIFTLKIRYMDGCFQQMWLWIWNTYGLPSGIATVSDAVRNAPASFYEDYFRCWAFKWELLLGTSCLSMSSLPESLFYYYEAIRHSRQDHETHGIAMACRLNLFQGNFYQSQRLLKLCTNHHFKACLAKELSLEAAKWTGTSGYITSHNGAHRWRFERVFGCAFQYARFHPNS